MRRTAPRDCLSSCPDTSSRIGAIRVTTKIACRSITCRENIDRLNVLDCFQHRSTSSSRKEVTERLMLCPILLRQPHRRAHREIRTDPWGLARFDTALYWLEWSLGRGVYQRAVVCNPSSVSRRIASGRLGRSGCFRRGWYDSVEQFGQTLSGRLIPQGFCRGPSIYSVDAAPASAQVIKNAVYSDPPSGSLNSLPSGPSLLMLAYSVRGTRKSPQAMPPRRCR